MDRVAVGCPLRQGGIFLCGTYAHVAVIASLLRSASGSAPTVASKVNNFLLRPLAGPLPPEDSIMSDTTITEAMKQIVITRLATINSATSILSLINGRPAKVTADEVVALAARIEKWAWRDLLDAKPPHHPTADTTQPTLETPAAEASPSQQQEKPRAALPARSTQPPPRPNGHSQRRGEATENQINAIFAIGKAKGHTSHEIEAWVQERCHKGTTALNKQEASMLIADLNAM